ncbi:hypothetical protein SAMN04488115_107289 [Bosea lathyri]|uniref:Uncharacterized protein n=1 Tax=Bosea lathyri TaxID=1036778 RepID=A0A1H6BJK1_9HYPH|nr:hypothetical protein SAMN04488115_107289 [Bosea lathyri]
MGNETAFCRMVTLPTSFKRPSLPAARDEETLRLDKGNADEVRVAT